MTKTELVKNAFDLFRLYGVKSSSMDDISFGLNVAKKTLYKYFDSKEILLNECVKYRISQLGIFKTLDDELLDILLACYESYPVIWQNVDRRFGRDIKKYYPGVYNSIIEFLVSYAAACGEKVKSGVRNGYVRKNVSKELVYFFLRERLFRLFLCEDIVESGRDGSLDAEMILFFAHGISTSKGGAYINKKLKERMYNETC